MASLIYYKHFVPIGTDKRGCIKRHFLPRIYFCGRALQSPISSASGDASYNLVEWGTVSVKLPFFSRIRARDRKLFTGVFPNLG